MNIRDTRLIQTLKTFTKDEIKGFEKFIASPFFNEGRNYMPFVHELKKYHPEFTDDRLTSEKIYCKIYPGRKFNRQVMWNQVSQLEKLAIEFLTQISLKGNSTERFVLKFDELSKRNLDKEISKEISKTDVQIDKMKLGKDYYTLSYICESNKAEYWNVHQGRQDKSLAGTINSTELLLLNYISDISAQLWDLHILKVMYSSGKEIDAAIGLIKSLDLKKLVSNFKQSGSRHFEIANFYYNKIMCAADENDESHFFEMKKFFEENYSRFDQQEQVNTVISLANYCAHKMRLGDNKFLRILFELNKFRLDNEIETYGNGRINKALYHQVLRNALSLGEIMWAEQFVKKYTIKLKKEHQKTMGSLALGYIHFAKKDYEKSLTHLNSVELIDLRDKLHIRILTSKAYFELGKTELLFYHIDSSKHFISNTPDIDPDTRNAYLKFFNYMKRLLLCRDSTDSKKLKSLKADVHLDSMIRLRHKEWLLEKLKVKS